MKIALIAVAILLGGQIIGSDSSTIRSQLAASGGDPDATGTMSGKFTPAHSSFKVAVANLDPGQVYTVVVGGMTAGEFTVSTSGKGKLEFVAPERPGKVPLWFDPRNQLVTVDQLGTPVLEGVFYGAAEENASSGRESVEFEAENSGDDDVAKCKYTQSSSGKVKFVVTLKKVADLETVLFVDGQEQGRQTPVHGKALFQYANDPVPNDYALLTFEPRGAVIDLIQEGTLIFSGQMLADGLGASLDSPNAAIAEIPSTNLDPDGTATAKYRVDEQAHRSFSVELENVPVGLYDLYADDTLTGAIAVTEVGGQFQGEIEFSNSDDDELPLAFDPLGALLSVRQGAAVFFEGVFDPGAGGVPPPEPPSLLQEDLASTGVDPDATGEVEYEVDGDGQHRFKVRIRDVALGSYRLLVGGVQRGTIKAVLSGGEVEGELEFSSEHGSGEILLDFDPRNLLIEVVDPAGLTLFSHLLGSGNGGGGMVQPLTMELPLFAEPGIAGVATAFFRRKDDGEEKLKIEIRGALVGDYDLTVGGLSVGTVTVVVDGSDTEGEAEFETDPEVGDGLLSVPVLGQEIILSQGGITKFARIMPAE